MIVFGAEVGGRWSEETAEFLSSLVWPRSASCLKSCRLKRAEHGWVRRWQRLLACAAAKAFSMSLRDLSNGATPSVHEVIDL